MTIATKTSWGLGRLLDLDWLIDYLWGKEKVTTCSKEGVRVFQDCFRGD